jgi:hypothetical protein
MQWISRYAPAEQARRHEQGKRDAMARLPPTTPQLAYLKALGDGQPAPANRAEASARIDHLIQQRKGA